MRLRDKYPAKPTSINARSEQDTGHDQQKRACEPYSVKLNMKDKVDGLTQRNIYLVEVEQGCGYVR